MSIEVLTDSNNNNLSSGIVAIHAALVPTANGGAAIVYFGTDDQAWIFDVDDLEQAPAQLSTQPGWWAFCGAHAFLNDGRWVIAGGVVNQNVTHHGHEEHDSGERRCEMYSPLAGTFSPIQDLNFQPGANYGGGRWYPTVLSLANGEVFVVAGHPFSGIETAWNEQGEAIDWDFTGHDDYVYEQGEGPRHNNNTPERYSPNKDKWTLLTAESTSHNNLDIDEYPRLHLAPSGHVFFSTIAKDNLRFYDPISGTYNGVSVSGGSSDYHRGSGYTSVMLPILPNDPDNIWVLACGAASTEKINIKPNNPSWESAGTPPLAKARVHACAVILPTGSVFLNGGEVDGGPLTPPSELYHPPIDWGAGQYIDGPGEWDDIETPVVERGYHNVALLMPDGRVWIAGSTWSDWHQSEKRMEVYTPPYIVPGRVEIEAAPPSVGYGAQFRVRLSSTTTISRVVLIRCGSVTHAFDADQRYIVCQFGQEDDRLFVTAPEGPGIAPPGNYLLFVLDSQMLNGHGRPCQRAAILRVCDQECTPVNNRSTYSKLEVDALKGNGDTAVFPDSIWLFLENFRPHEANHPTAPSLSVFWDSGGGQPIDPDLFRLEPQNPWLEDDTLPPDIAQRFTLRYNVRIHEDVYEDVNVERNVFVRWDFGHFVCTTTLELTTKPNPYMVDVAGGNVHWLSTDLRVFHVREGANPPAGAPEIDDGETPFSYLQKVLSQYNGADNNSSHPFLDLEAGQDASALELRTSIGGKRVYNFAIAKVRYVAQGQNADDVRVFFRMFNTVGTMLEFNTSTTYRRHGNGENAVPLLGHFGPLLVSIPFFENPRVTPDDDMTQQPPDTARTITAEGAAESVQYFGAWLDINQTDPHIPPLWTDDGPFNEFFPLDNPQSIYELVRNYHQCLIAEVHFLEDSIPDANTSSPGTPANNDNLSQRNLAWVPVGNPGAVATRTAQTTFIARPSGGTATETYMPVSVVPHGQVLRTARLRRRGPDELIFDGRQVPRGSRVTVYLPDIDADEIINLATRRSSPVKLSRIDQHTLSFELRRTAYLPLPGGRTTPVIGLLSVELPAGILKGQRYRLVVHQLSGVRMRVIGTFQLEIPVFEEASLLAGESIKLSVLRWIFERMSGSDPWHPVFKRYLGEIEDRVTGFGGDPDLVGPSPNGDAYPGGGGQVPQPDGDHDTGEEQVETWKKFVEWAWTSVGWYRKSLVWLATAILAIFFLQWTGIATPVLTLLETGFLVVTLLGMALTILFGVIAWHAAIRWAQAAAEESNPALTDPDKKMFWHQEKLKWRNLKRECDRIILVTFLIGIVALTLFILSRLL
jgi:Domain of unknown function (DUF1929)